jgi:hypothetical protein
MVMCSDNETSPRQSLPASPSSPISNQRSFKGKGRAIDGYGDVEMAEARHKKFVFFGFFCPFFRLFFLLDGQAAAAPIPHKSRTLSHSPNRLKSHPMVTLANVNDVSEERFYKDTSLPMLNSPQPLQPHLYDLAATYSSQERIASSCNSVCSPSRPPLAPLT